jgi:uncharacterized membrane protein
MIEQLALTFASLLIVATMLVHSMLGQRRLIRPLLDQAEGVMQRPMARFIVPFAWHLTSFIGLIVAAVLLAFAWVPEHATTVGISATAIVFTVGGILDAFGSRGKHVGWVPLTLIGISAFVALLSG